MKCNVSDYLKYQRDKYYLKDISGAKVKIDTDRILSRPDGVSKVFEDFITSNSNTIFTAKLDVDNNYTKMYILEEDTSEFKWLFHIEDLIVHTGVGE